MHLVLRHQLERLGLSIDSLPEHDSWRTLLDQISSVYEQSDSDRCLMEHSLKHSSERMSDLHQRQQQELDARLKAILKAIPDYLFVLDIHGRCLEVLAGAPDGQAFSRDNVVGKTVGELLEPDVAGKIMEAIQVAVASDTEQTVEYLLHDHGVERVYEGRLIPLREPEGESLLLLLVRDISVRAEREGMARLLDTVLSQASEGIVIVRGNDRRVLYANDAVSDILGYAPNELTSGGEGFLRHQLDKAICDEICTEAGEQAHVQKEISVHDREGHDRELWLSIDTLRDSDGEIEFFVALINDLTELHRSRKRLAHQATHDRLTGLPNRDYLNDHLEHVLSRIRRQRSLAAVLLLDLDRFKQINDSLGHLVGDEVLIEAAQRIDNACRKEDFVARLGGDEFVMVLEDLDSNTDAGRVAEKILLAFSDPIVLRDNGELYITPSIGIRVFPESGDEGMDELLKHADSAMYAAKERGGNCFHFHHRELTRKAVAQLELERALRRAIDEQAFVVYYQPQYGLNVADVQGMEALVRWPQQDGSLRMPGEFIPIAELSGLIVSLGFQVLEQVCRQIAAWEEEGVNYFQVAVNVSARQLADAAFAPRLEALLEQYRVPHGCLELEVTESVEVPVGSVRMQNIEQLQAKGLRFAVDDFGTGHSSLANLKRLPLSCIKIDRSFVRDVGRDPGDEAIIRAMVAMAKELGLDTVAEGVEEEQQLAFLRELDCERVQGSLLGRPIPGDEMTRLLNGD